MYIMRMYIHIFMLLRMRKISWLFARARRVIRASVDALSRDGTDMRGDAQNPKSFQAPRM